MARRDDDILRDARTHIVRIRVGLSLCEPRLWDRGLGYDPGRIGASGYSSRTLQPDAAIRRRYINVQRSIFDVCCQLERDGCGTIWRSDKDLRWILDKLTLDRYLVAIEQHAGSLDEQSVSQLQAAADTLRPWWQHVDSRRIDDQICRVDGSPRGPFRNGRCPPCAEYFRRHGRERPQHLWRNTA